MRYTVRHTDTLGPTGTGRGQATQQKREGSLSYLVLSTIYVVNLYLMVKASISDRLTRTTIEYLAYGREIVRVQVTYILEEAEEAKNAHILYPTILYFLETLSFFISETNLSCSSLVLKSFLSLQLLPSWVPALTLPVLFHTILPRILDRQVGENWTLWTTHAMETRTAQLPLKHQVAPNSRITS